MNTKPDSTFVTSVHAISHANFDMTKSFAKIKKAASKGKTSIRLKCSETDYDCAWSFATMPKTPLVSQLLAHGFHVKPESYWFFYQSYSLYISW